MNRPMNTCKFSFMKYIRVMMLALLTLCGNGVMGQTFDYSEVQDIHIYPSSADEYSEPSCELTPYTIDAVKNCLAVHNPFFIRWYVQDENDNICELESSMAFASSKWLLAFDVKSYNPYNNWPMTYDGNNKSFVFYYPNGTSLWGEENNFAKWDSSDPFCKYLLRTTLYSPDGNSLLNTFSDVVVCEVSDEAYNSSSANKVKIRVVYHFQEKKVEDNFSNLPSDLEPTSITPSYTYSALTAQPAINVDLSAQQSEGVNYVRWYLTKDGSEVSTDGWALATDGITYQTYQNSRYFYTATASTDLLKLTVTPPAGVKLADYQLVCLVSDNDDVKAVATDGTLDTDGEPLTTEPTIDAQYIISFEEIPFENTASATSHTYTIDYSGYTPQPLSVGLSTINGSQGNPIYARVGLQSVSDGSFVSTDGWTITSGGSLTQDGTYGNTFYYNESEATVDLLTWNIQAPDGISIDDYRLVVWVASTTAGSSTAGDVLTTEPTIENKYTISFNKVAFENAASISETKKPQAVNIYEALINGTSLPLMLEMDDAPCYVRWYWASDDDGNTMIDASGWSLQTQGGGSFTTYNTTSYYSFSNTALDDLKTLSVTPPSGSTLKQIVDNGWKLVALVSTSTDGSKTETVNETTHLIKEPTIQTKYVISFTYDDPNFDGALSTDKGGVETVVKEIELTISSGQQQFDLTTLFDDWKILGENEGMRGVFDLIGPTTNNQGNVPKYRRVYVRNKSTQEILDNQQGWIAYYQNGASNASSDMFFYTTEGHFWTRTYNVDYKQGNYPFNYSYFHDNRYQAVLSTQINVPNGSGLTLEDIEVVFILSNENARTEGVVDGTYTITQGPATHQVEYYFTFDDGVNTFPGSAKADAIDATFTEQLTADQVTSSYALSLSSKLDDAAQTKLANTVYFRWEVTDANGNVVTDDVVTMTMNGGIANDNLHTFTEYGKVWYAGYTVPAATFSNALLDVTLVPAAGKKLTDYTYTCYMATDLTNAVQDGEGEFTEEPDYDARYVFKLEQYPFENVPEGITDYPGSKSINWLTTQPMAISLADYCTADGGQPAITYVRYLLTDKSGNEVPWNNAGVTLTAPDGHSFTAQGNSQYIYQATATSDLLTVNLQATTLANLQNYNLKAYVSAQTADIATTQREPQIEAVYTVSFDAVTFENTVSATENKTINIYDELTYANIPVDLGGEAPTYVRWYWSLDGNKVAQTDWTFDNTDVTFSEYNGTEYFYAGATPNADLNQLTITPPAETAAKTLPSTNLKLVALVSTKTADDGAILDASSNLVKEPLIDKKYIISFASVPFEKSNSIHNATKKEDIIYVTDEQKNGNASVSVELDDNLPTILSTFDKSNATDLDAGFYLRWYIVDGSGNRVTDLTGWSLSSANDGVTYTVNDYGHYWSSALNTSIKVSENQNLMNLVVKSPSGTDLTSYKAVCVMSANLNDATVIEDKLVSEPTWTLQYTYSFASLTFEGSTTGAQSLSETIRLADDAMSSVTLSLPLSSVQDYMDNVESSFYIRYYLTDKTGNRVDLPTGVTITPKDITLTSSDYGHYWYSSTGIGSITDLGVTVADANGTVDLRNYNVVAVMSSNAPLQVETDGTVTYEPREMEVVYTYELKKPISNDFDGNLASGGIRVQKLIPYEEGTTSITLTNVRDDWDKLKDLFEPSKNYYEFGTDAKTPRYRRVFVRNKQTGDILDWAKDATDETFNLSENGNIWTARYDIHSDLYNNSYRWFNPENSKLLTTTIQVPSGSSLELSDVEVVFILAQGDAREETLDPWSITKGPEEHEVEYIFSFISEKYLPFVHYKGVTGRDWVTVSSNPLLGKFENQAYDATTDETTVVKDDIRQGTHEWTYEIYVKPGAKKSLMLPIQRVIDYGNDLEPQGYFRWYNWNTDFESDNIQPYNADNTSKPKLEKRFYQIIDKIDKVERSRGLIAWWWGNKQTNATANNVAAVNYKAPESGWEGETIACDVSKYIDGLNIVTENNQTSIDFVHEPTLSYRYKYIVRPASVIADKIVAGVKGGNRALYEEELLENHGNVTLAVAPTGESYNPYKGTTTLRLNLSDVNNYYFYPYDAVKKTWDKTDNKIYEATSITWVMYDASGNKLKDLTPMDDNTFCKVTYTNNGPKIGELFYVIAFAANESYSAPIAKFNCKFVDNSHPILFDAGSNGEAIPDFRTIDYLEENYTRVALISFDIEEGSTLTAPTDQIDNTNPFPFAWNRSFYGYCYPQLYGDMAGHAADYAGLGTLHGDYRLVKKAWDGTFAYTELWHAGKGLLDRTNDLTDGVQSGYFLYVDASDESRPIANVQFEGDMCVGSTVVLSAAVAQI